MQLESADGPFDAEFEEPGPPLELPCTGAIARSGNPEASLEASTPQGPAPSTSYNVMDGVYAAEIDALVNKTSYMRMADGLEGAEDGDEVGGPNIFDFQRMLDSLKLTRAEKLALRIGPGLAVADGNELLAVLTEYGICRWKNVLELDAWMEAVPVLGQGWEQVKLLTIELMDQTYEFTCRFVRDMHSVLDDFALKNATVGAPWEIRNQHGELLFGRVQMGKRYAELYVSLIIISCVFI